MAYHLTVAYQWPPNNNSIFSEIALKSGCFLDGLWLLVQDSASLLQHNDMDNTPTDHQEAEYLLTSNVLVELSSREKMISG